MRWSELQIARIARRTPVKRRATGIVDQRYRAGRLWCGDRLADEIARHLHIVPTGGTPRQSQNTETHQNESKLMKSWHYALLLKQRLAFAATTIHNTIANHTEKFSFCLAHVRSESTTSGSAHSGASLA